MKKIILIMMTILAVMTVSAYELDEYPKRFDVIGTTKTIVVGEAAALSDIRAANMILSGLQSKVDLIANVKGSLPMTDDDSLEIVNPFAIAAATTDNNIDSYTDNMIIVGGPCVNEVANKLLGYPKDCTEGFKKGEARIEVHEIGLTDIILVAGYTKEDTVAAAEVLGNHYNWKLEGKSMKIITGQV